ncbi:MAG TPA: phosphoribosylaminoimidazolecarboxamide formyltransferase [Ktedonobacterales bacterium]|nr:phosphoribosylaminoimidazolecarboxamide formyltransferase [Ktedonobacterales bacterium]
MSGERMTLRYGMNPHQRPAFVSTDTERLPVRVLNGSPGYINLLDALNSWQLVRELHTATDLPAAASFKHVSPAGAAIGTPLSDMERQAYFVATRDLSPLATAYARARGADRVSSYGDFVALSDPVDVPTARLLRPEVSDGVIAPGYEPDALDLLRAKKGGKYLVLCIDPAYEPPEMESRDVFGLTLVQQRNSTPITRSDLQHITTQAHTLPESAVCDLLIALITLKYTQSNSVCLALNGQAIGIGAGQQSRIHCTRLAASKAEMWYLRQHPTVLALPFRRDVRRPDRDNAIDQYLRADMTSAEERDWVRLFEQRPVMLSREEQRAWLDGLCSVSLASDGSIPFRDNIDRAQRTGVRYVAQPGGSARDADVVAACDEYGIVMVDTGVRLFHH